MPDDDNCKVCNKDLVLNKKVALLCDSCNMWHCYTCLGVDKRLYEVLNKENIDTTMVTISCKECLKESSHIKIVKQISEVKRDISLQIKDLSNKIAQSSLKQEEAVEIVKTHNAEAKASWANAVKMGLESSQSIKAVQDAVKVLVSKNIEMGEKDRSIIMFHHPESTKTNSPERKKEDLEFVENFIDEGLKISGQPIQSCFRLGRYDENKVRPMKVIFCQKVGQVKVLDNLSALRGAQGDYSRISVCIDRDAAERKVVQDLVQKAKQQTDQSDNKRYVVRGTFSPYIQEFNKQ